MTGKTFQIIAFVALIAFAGTVTVAVVASGNPGGQNAGFLGHLRTLVGQHLHGGGGQHNSMAQLVETLDLTADQLQRFRKVQEVVESYPSGGDRSMVKLHEELVTQLEDGQVSTAAARQAVDRHIEEMRVMAYEVTDGLVALVNELDDTQRGVLLEHLQGTSGGDHGH